MVWTLLAILASRIQIRLSGLSTRLSMGFFVVLMSAALLRWPESAVVACLNSLVESALWIRPRPRWKATWFNAATSVLSASAAYATYRIPSAPSPLLMVLAAIVYFAVSSVLLVIFTARQENKPAGMVWKQSFFWTFPHYLAGGSAAGLLVIADRHNAWQITLLVVPHVVLDVPRL